MDSNEWDIKKYHGRYNRYPFTEVVSFVMQNYGKVEDRSRVRILDLGCGGAHHLMFLAQEGFDYYGIDGAEESIAIAKSRLSDAGFKSANVKRGLFDSLPYANGTFDCVIDRGSLTCNRRNDIPPLLLECRRVMRKNGKMFSMILHEASSSREGADHIGNGDYTNFKGRLEHAGVLHFTNLLDVKSLFSMFAIEDIELITRQSVLSEESKRVDAWMAVTCHK